MSHLADSYTTCFKNSKLLRRERLKSASLNNRHLTLLLAFLGCIRIKCVKNPNGGYHTASQKKEIKKKRKCRNELIRQFTVKSRKMLRARKGKRDQVVGICVSEHSILLFKRVSSFLKQSHRLLELKKHQFNPMQSPAAFVTYFGLLEF